MLGEEPVPWRSIHEVLDHPGWSLKLYTSAHMSLIIIYLFICLRQNLSFPLYQPTVYCVYQQFIMLEWVSSVVLYSSMAMNGTSIHTHTYASKRHTSNPILVLTLLQLQLTGFL